MDAVIVGVWVNVLVGVLELSAVEVLVSVFVAVNVGLLSSG